MNKETLREFRNRNREVYQIREQLEEMEARIYSPKIQKLSSMPRGGSGSGRSMEELTAVHIQLQDKYRASLAEVERQQLQIEQAMVGLDPAQRMVIRYRYIDCLNWETVADRMHYGWTQTHRIHAAALQALEKSK